MNIGAKETNRLRDWDDDYLEGFSEYLSEHVDDVEDSYDTLICQTCNDGQMLSVWHTGFDRFVQVLLPIDRYRCSSCQASRWQFNHFKGFTATTFVLYAVSLALVLFFGTTTLGILLDRQNNEFSLVQMPITGASDPSAANQNLTEVSSEAPASRFDEIVDNPLSNTLFEPVDGVSESTSEGGAGSGVVLLPAAFRITFVPNAPASVELEDQSLSIAPNPIESGLDSAGSQVEAAVETAQSQSKTAQSNVALNQPVTPATVTTIDDVANSTEMPTGSLEREPLVVEVAVASEDTSAARVESIVQQESVDSANTIDGNIIEAPAVEVAVAEKNTVEETDLQETSQLEAEMVEAEIVEATETDQNVWLFSQSPSAYTAQLGSFNSLAAAESFVMGNDLSDSDVHILETASNDKVWFYVLYGSFELRVDVDLAVEQLGFSAPLIRKFSGLQTKRCASWENLDQSAYSANCRL